jgi:hypothetical protein
MAKAALAGASNREIAIALCYSVKSVEAYLTRVYRRLGIEGRSGLPAVADEFEDLEPQHEQAEFDEDLELEDAEEADNVKGGFTFQKDAGGGTDKV